MDNASFDFVVIGGGSAGYAAARTAHAEGLRVAVIDGAAELGGLCILRGCMPSKTLIESADRYASARRAAEFGLNVQALGVDVRAIRDRKRALIADFAAYRTGQLEDGRFTLIRGTSRFTDAQTVEVTLNENGNTLFVTSKFFCIATGSVANIPDIEGLSEVGYWTSDDILDADALPESFAVLGGGAIALEMAHYLAAIGKKVTIVQRGERFLSGLDPECSEVIQQAYSQRGMICHLGARVERVTLNNGQKHLEVCCQSNGKRVTADQILVALGRTPATAGLGLDKAGVKLTLQKVEVQATMQTSQPHIFAAGDVCSPLDVVHVAIQQGEIAARNAARLMRGEPLHEEMDYRLRLFGVFSHPQVAVVGASEKTLRQNNVKCVTSSYPFNDHGKSMVMGETEGFVKMIADQSTGEILGASCVGPHATELIHEVVIAMHYRSRVQDFMSIPHYHPTLSEIWTYPAEDCADQISNAKK